MIDHYDQFQMNWAIESFEFNNTPEESFGGWVFRGFCPHYEDLIAVNSKVKSTNQMIDGLFPSITIIFFIFNLVALFFDVVIFFN